MSIIGNPTEQRLGDTIDFDILELLEQDDNASSFCGII